MFNSIKPEMLEILYQAESWNSTMMNNISPRESLPGLKRWRLEEMRFFHSQIS